MKARAMRGRRDLDDVGVLVGILNYTELDEVWKTCEAVWGFDVFSPESKEVLAEYLKTRGIQ
jgi:hypothetical protein